jgi:hypothetical protein
MHREDAWLFLCLLRFLHVEMPRVAYTRDAHMPKLVFRGNDIGCGAFLCGYDEDIQTCS